jgi:excisionase family DNA binding protein
MVDQGSVLADPIPAACRRIGISRSTAYILIAQGSLRAVKAGGRTLVLRSDQEAFVNSLPAVPVRRAAVVTA